MVKEVAVVLFSSRMVRTLVGGAVGLVAACVTHGAGVEGQVFELVNPEAPTSQWTHVPSADAYVIVHWQGTIPRPGHAESVCLHAAIGKTDARGRFEVSGSWAAPKGFPVIRRDPAVMVHKPGFVQQSDFRSGGTPVVRTLVRSKLAAEQRVALLSMYAQSGCRDHDTFKMIPLGNPQGSRACSDHPPRPSVVRHPGKAIHRRLVGSTSNLLT